jgi:hypothetical protein
MESGFRTSPADRTPWVTEPISLLDDSLA